MYSLTPIAVRALIDDLDDIYRAAVMNGTTKKVFAEEQKTLVSLMNHEVHME